MTVHYDNGYLKILIPLKAWILKYALKRHKKRTKLDYLSFIYAID